MIVPAFEWVTAVLTTVIGDADKVHYVTADLNAPYPLFVYHSPSYVPDDEMGSWDTTDREVIFSIQARSRDSLEAIRLINEVDRVMDYATPDLGTEWSLIGCVRFSGGVPDPGNRLPDNSLVYYAGNMYTMQVSRSRPNVE